MLEELAANVLFFQKNSSKNPEQFWFLLGCALRPAWPGTLSSLKNSLASQELHISGDLEAV